MRRQFARVAARIHRLVTFNEFMNGGGILSRAMHRIVTLIYMASSPFRQSGAPIGIVLQDHQRSGDFLNVRIGRQLENNIVRVILVAGIIVDDHGHAMSQAVENLYPLMELDPGEHPPKPDSELLTA